MKKAVLVDTNYKKTFYPSDTFRGLSISDASISKIINYTLTSKDENSKVDVCGDLIQQTVFDNKNEFAATAVSKINRSEERIELYTCFARSFFWSEKSYPVIVNAFHLTQAGEVIIDGTLVNPDDPDVSAGIEFQDVDFFALDEPYELGKVYNFKFAGIAYIFMKRPKEYLYIQVNEGPFAGEKISTIEMDGMLSAGEDIAASAHISQQFSSFQEAFFRTPFSKTDVRVYDYYWKNGPVRISFPISVGDAILNGQKFSSGDPIEIAATIQGFSV